MARQIGFNNKNDLGNVPYGGELLTGDKVLVQTDNDCQEYVLKTVNMDEVQPSICSMLLTAADNNNFIGG